MSVGRRRSSSSSLVPAITPIGIWIVTQPQSKPQSKPGWSLSQHLHAHVDDLETRMQYLEAMIARTQLTSTPQRSQESTQLSDLIKASHRSPPDASPMNASVLVHEASVIAASPPSFARWSPERVKQPTMTDEDFAGRGGGQEGREGRGGGWSVLLVAVVLTGLACGAVDKGCMTVSRAFASRVEQGVMATWADSTRGRCVAGAVMDDSTRGRCVAGAVMDDSTRERCVAGAVMDDIEMGAGCLLRSDGRVWCGAGRDVGAGDQGTHPTTNPQTSPTYQPHPHLSMRGRRGFRFRV